MPPPKDPLPKAAVPVHSAHFDPWNSSGTGHQRAEQRPDSGWRDSRNSKLNSQFRGGSTGGQRLNDTCGAGSEDWDERRKALVPKAVRERAARSVRDMLVQPGKMQESLGVKKGSAEGGGNKDDNNDEDDDYDDCDGKDPATTAEEALTSKRRLEDDAREAAKASPRGIFDGVVVYVNGSTFPLVSDHRLKHILTENGGQMSFHLGRRRVTHVILGRPAGGGARAGGTGGGLAGGKLEREIRRVGGCGIKFVGAEWVLESLSAGKRLPETRFSNMKVAPKSQGSVYNFYAQNAPPKQ